jgi:hypothetical protein
MEVWLRDTLIILKENSKTYWVKNLKTHKLGNFRKIWRGFVASILHN